MTKIFKNKETGEEITIKVIQGKACENILLDKLYKLKGRLSTADTIPNWEEIGSQG